MILVRVQRRIAPENAGNRGMRPREATVSAITERDRADAFAFIQKNLSPGAGRD